MSIEQERTDFEAWAKADGYEDFERFGEGYAHPELREAWRGYQAGRAALQSQPSHAGWKEAAIAWEVCASLHREFCKSRDPFFKTRQADFVKHAEDARTNALETKALQSQDREDAVGRLIEALKSYMHFGCPVCSGDCHSANPPVSGCPVREAQQAIDHARRAEGNEMSTKTPYQEGAEAKRSGKTWLDCPYTDFYRRSQWFRGWDSARLIEGGGE